MLSVMVDGQVRCNTGVHSMLYMVDCTSQASCPRYRNRMCLEITDVTTSPGLLLHPPSLPLTILTLNPPSP